MSNLPDTRGLGSAVADVIMQASTNAKQLVASLDAAFYDLTKTVDAMRDRIVDLSRGVVGAESPQRRSQAPTPIGWGEHHKSAPPGDKARDISLYPSTARRVRRDPAPMPPTVHDEACTSRKREAVCRWGAPSAVFERWTGEKLSRGVELCGRGFSVRGFPAVAGISGRREVAREIWGGNFRDNSRRDCIELAIGVAFPPARAAIGTLPCGAASRKYSVRKVNRGTTLLGVPLWPRCAWSPCRCPAVRRARSCVQRLDPSSAPSPSRVPCGRSRVRIFLLQPKIIRMGFPSR